MNSSADFLLQSKGFSERTWPVINITLTVSLIVWGLFLQFHLFFKRNSFPYKNLSILWQSYFIISLVCQLGLVLTNMLLSQLDHFLDLINKLYFAYVFMIPNFSRCIFNFRSLQLNYYHLNQKFNNTPETKQTAELAFMHRFTDQRGNFLNKIVFLPFLTFLLFFGVLLSIPQTRCICYNVSIYNLNLRNDCNDSYFSLKGIEYQISTGIILIVIQIAVYLTIMIKLIQYPIKKDTFFILAETIGVFCLWFVSMICKIYFEVFGKSLFFEGNSIQNYINFRFSLKIIVTLGYFSLFTFLTFKRSRIQKEEMDSILNDFNTFLYNHICFGFFKEYLSKKHPSHYRHLEFWLEGNIFKRLSIINNNSEAGSLKLKSDIVKKNRDAENSLISSESKRQAYNKSMEYLSNKRASNNQTLKSEQSNMSIYFKQDRQKAMSIFYTYFMNSEETVAGLHEIEDTFMNERDSKKINFPFEIANKVSGVLSINFKENPELKSQICNVFDEALNFAFKRLYEKYMLLCRDTEEYQKMSNLIYYFDFYDFKDDVRSSKEYRHSYFSVI